MICFILKPDDKYMNIPLAYTRIGCETSRQDGKSRWTEILQRQYPARFRRRIENAYKTLNNLYDVSLYLKEPQEWQVLIFSKCFRAQDSGIADHLRHDEILILRLLICKSLRWPEHFHCHRLRRRQARSHREELRRWG